MPHDGQSLTQTALLADLLSLTEAALPEVEALFAAAREALRAQVTVAGKISGAALEEHQFAAHALAWLATYVESLRQMRAWAGRLDAEGKFGEMEALILQIGFGEYLAQIHGGIPMSQGEIARASGPRRWPLPAPGPAAATLIAQATPPAARERLVALMRDNHGRATFGATGLDDELEMIRDQFRRFADEQVVPFAHDWHLKDELIPMEIIRALAEMGVFGLTIPEEFGGLGLSKASDGRGLRGTVARLYRRRLARHPLRDRGRTDPLRRHARAEGAVAAEARQRRNPADRRVHRTQHRLRPWQPAHPRGEGGRRLRWSPATRPGSPTPPAPM